jgi:hypothetical protein
VIARNVRSRIQKLELGRRRPNEFLLVWRRPNGDVKAAASEAKFAPGDRVTCLEWFGDSPLPAPRWHGKRSEFSVIEEEYLDRCLTGALTRVEEGVCRRDPGFADFPHVPAERMRELHDNDLLHMLFGVAT